MNLIQKINTIRTNPNFSNEEKEMLERVLVKYHSTLYKRAIELGSLILNNKQLH